MTRWDEPAASTFDPGAGIDTGPTGHEVALPTPRTSPARRPALAGSIGAGDDGGAGGIREAELGRGAGGTVVRGLDRHLPRMVAWKIATGASARARLEHEARVLAALDHPAIVAIHDLVDEPEEDQLRIALRMVRGETLHAAIRRAPALADRLRLLRAFLHAVEAVAWAHRAGWIHRDLKPANLMIGELGETQVIDWGLAVAVDGPRAESPGTVVGTPTTMSPEQARGERVGPGSDVWGLGATLFELVAGRPLHDVSGDPRALLERLRSGDRPRIAEVTPETPPELAAIIEQSLAPAVEDRYPDAAALAADLAAYLDGRHVAAHAYSARELLVRFVRAWRLPLGIAAAVLVTGAVAFTIAFREVGRERDVALAAQREALAAVAARDAEVAEGGIIAARRELADDQRPEAELAAARALEVRESPEARGVLMALGHAPRPARVGGFTPPRDCVDLALAPDGAGALCGTRDAFARVDARGATWTSPSPYVGLSFVDGGRAVLALRPDAAIAVHDARDGRVLGVHAPTTCHGSLRTDPTGGHAVVVDHSCVERVSIAARTALHVCDARHIEAVAVAPDGRVVAVCVGGDLDVRALDGRPSRRPSAIGDASDTLLSAVVVDPRHLLVGTAVGELWLVDLDDGAIVARRALTPAAPVRELDASPQGGLALALLDGQGPLVVRGDTLASVARLPRADARAARFLTRAPDPASPLAGADLATYGAAIDAWSLDVGPPARLDGLGGVTWITPAPTLAEAHRLVVTHDATALVLDAATGRHVASARWLSVIAKAATVVGDEVRVGLAGRRSGEPMLGVDPASDPRYAFRELPALRRVAALSGGRMVGSRTGPGILYWPGPDAAPVEASATQMTDLAARGDWGAALEASPRVAALWDLRADPVELARCPTPSAVAIGLAPAEAGQTSPDLLVVSPSSVATLDADCAPRALFVAPGSELTRAATTREGRFVAAGTRAGDVLVWTADGTLVATASVHAGPVTTLAVDDARGEWFASGAWDGRVAFLALAPLELERAALVAAVREAWRGPSRSRGAE